MLNNENEEKQLQIYFIVENVAKRVGGTNNEMKRLNSD